jgi:predicted GTPase
LEETINRIPCDVVLIATPVDLGRIITITHPTCRVTYRLEEQGTLGFRDVMQGIILNAKKG